MDGSDSKWTVGEHKPFVNFTTESKQYGLKEYTSVQKSLFVAFFLSGSLAEILTKYAAVKLVTAKLVDEKR